MNKFRNEGHSKDGFSVMNELRKQNTLTDVTLVAEGATFPVHKLVVASCSPYFKERIIKDLFIYNFYFCFMNNIRLCSMVQCLNQIKIELISKVSKAKLCANLLNIFIRAKSR